MAQTRPHATGCQGSGECEFYFLFDDGESTLGRVGFPKAFHCSSRRLPEEFGRIDQPVAYLLEWETQ